MTYEPPALEYIRIINGFGLYIKKVGCARYVTVARQCDHRRVTEFDAPYVGKLRDLYRVFMEFGAKRKPCPEHNDAFSSEQIADIREWRSLLVKNARGDYELFCP